MILEDKIILYKKIEDYKYYELEKDNLILYVIFNILLFMILIP